jgi:PAS domain S-box-containing protein
MRKRRRNSVAARLQPIAAGERCVPCVREVIVGTATLSEEDRVVSWDTWAERLTGYTLEEIQARPLLYLFNPVDLFHHNLQLAHAGIPTTSEPFHLRHACGRPVPMDMLCSPMRHVYAGAERVVVVLHEVCDAFQALTLHTDILEDVLQRPMEDGPSQLARSLAAIKSDARHLQRLFDLDIQTLSAAFELQGDKHERMAW